MIKINNPKIGCSTICCAYNKAIVSFSRKSESFIGKNQRKTIEL